MFILLLYLTTQEQRFEDRTYTSRVYYGSALTESFYFKRCQFKEITTNDRAPIFLWTKTADITFRLTECLFNSCTGKSGGTVNIDRGSPNSHYINWRFVCISNCRATSESNIWHFFLYTPINI